MNEEEGGYDDIWFEHLPCLDLSMFDDDNDGNRSIGTDKTPTETQSADLTPCSSRKRDRNDFETDLSNVQVPNHVLNERDRRKRMNEAFTRLHALLPQSHNKKLFKGDVIEAAANYIKTLRDTLQQLQQEKERLASLTTINTYDQGLSSNVSQSSLNSLSFQALVSSKVFLNVCEGEAQYNIQSPKKLGTLSTILSVLDKYFIRVLYVSVSTNCGMTYYYIRALASEVHADTVMVMLKVEDRYRQAASEISQWVQ